MHGQNFIHRDVKPSNIVLCVSDASQGHLRLMIADFSRACRAPARRKLTKKSLPGPQEACMTSKVCTPAYCAPEALFPSHAEDVESGSVYGSLVDIWSFGAVLFEILTFDRFAPGHTSLECLVAVCCRLGSLPWRCGPLQAGHTENADRMGLQPLQAFKFSPWAVVLLQGSLCWASSQRQTASELVARMLYQESPVAQTPATQSPLHRGAKREAQDSGVGSGDGSGDGRARRREGSSSTPASISMSGGPQVAVCKISDTACACAGHCYTPGHRYHGACRSNSLLHGGRYCIECTCEVFGCLCPRLRGSRCSMHAKVWSGIPLELKLTHCARHCAVDLIPCDISDFLSRFTKLHSDLASLVLLVLLKEPFAIGVWMDTGVPGSLATTVGADGLVQSLLVVVRRCHTSPPTSEMQQVHRQGHA